MADRQISVARLVRLLEDRRTRGAMKIVEAGGSYEQYLIASGKFRENRALIQWLENLISGQAQKPEDEGEDDFDDEGDLDSEEEQVPAAAEPLVKRHKPRGWG